MNCYLSHIISKLTKTTTEKSTPASGAFNTVESPRKREYIMISQHKTNTLPFSE